MSRSGFGRRSLAGCAVAGAELRLGNVSQGALDLLQQHVASGDHLFQAGGGLVVLLLQLSQTGRLTASSTIVSQSFGLMLFACQKICICAAKTEKRQMRKYRISPQKKKSLKYNMSSCMRIPGNKNRK